MARWYLYSGYRPRLKVKVNVNEKLHGVVGSRLGVCACYGHTGSKFAYVGWMDHGCRGTTLSESPPAKPSHTCSQIVKTAIQYNKQQIILCCVYTMFFFSPLVNILLVHQNVFCMATTPAAYDVKWLPLQPPLTVESSTIFDSADLFLHLKTHAYGISSVHRGTD